MADLQSAQVPNRYTETDLSTKFFKTASIKETALRMYLDTHDVGKDVVNDLVAKVKEATTVEEFVHILHKAADIGTECILRKEARVE
jgi:hypothetical protein